MKKINPYAIYLLVYLILGVLSYIYFPTIANSNFVVASVTFIVGSLAFYIYTKQKNDEKNNAARILYLEVKESEKEISKLNEYKIRNPNTAYNQQDIIKIIPYKAWVKYSHLFIENFTNDEYQQLDEYFKRCDILEKYFEKQHSFFWISTEERARQKEQFGSKMAFDNPTLTSNDFKQKLEKDFDLYITNTLNYAPAGITTEINKQLDLIVQLSVTPLWNKIKDIAGYKS